jgi:hypothetical protein
VRESSLLPAAGVSLCRAAEQKEWNLEINDPSTSVPQWRDSDALAGVLGADSLASESTDPV